MMLNNGLIVYRRLKMNIFYLDRDPCEAARLQCDKHVVKMILETAQLLSTAHNELDGGQIAYKTTHKNHPSAVWVRQNRHNYRWLRRHLEALGDEYTRRYGNVHKTIQKHSQTLMWPPEAIPDGGFTDPPQCMPDDCKHEDTVIAYQTYYNQKADDWASRGMTMKWYGQEAV
jgi:hypothetical protein